MNNIPRKFLHDRLVLGLLSLISLLTVMGVSLVLIRFDATRNPTTTVAYRPNITGSQYQSGKPIDIYTMALFMLLTSALAALVAYRIYGVRRSLSIFMLAGQVFLLLVAAIVSNSLISLQ
jgi:hypothetical protein